MPLGIQTRAFAAGGRIPVKHTRDGDNLLPPLRWTGAPPGTKSFALVVDDPDAPGGTFTHFALFDMPRDRDHLAEGTGGAAATGGAKFGVNDFGNSRYDGPEPPRGHGVHHYHFKIAALDVAVLAVPAGASVKAVWTEATKHALATAEVVGTYER